jgi:hypothetical protein
VNSKEAETMAKNTRIKLESDPRKKCTIPEPITREFIHRLRGKYKGSGLLKALKAEKEKEMERDNFR